MKRAIVAFHEDDAADWVAELACGHRRHVRHQPPFSERPWVTSAQGRAGRIRSELACSRCDRSELPDGFAPYQRTAEFDESSVPRGLLARHTTKAGVWARIHVLRGRLDYHVHDPYDRHEVLTPDAPGVVLPEVEHHVAPSGPVSFYLEFWRRA